MYRAPVEWWLIAIAAVVIVVAIAIDVPRADRRFWPSWEKAKAERDRRDADQQRLHESIRRDDS